MADPVFIIRNGSFGTDFEGKLLLGILSLIFSLWTLKKTGKRDYVFVFLIGTLLWTILEFVIQFTGVREFNPVTLFGAGMPLPAVALLRGAAEGGFVVLFGLYIGDLLLAGETRARGLVFLGVLAGMAVLQSCVQAFPFKDVGGLVASRRDVFRPVYLFATLGVTFFSIIWMGRVARMVRYRALALLGVMVAVSGVWTVAQCAANLRWVEVAVPGGFVRAPLLWEAGVLFYDVIFEIGFAYIPFFAISHFLGSLRDRS